MRISDWSSDVCPSDLKDPGGARVRIQGLFTVVANDPAKAMDELAPYYLHVNNTYGERLNEDRAATGIGNDGLLKPLTTDPIKASGIPSILTTAQAIDMFRKMLAKEPRSEEPRVGKERVSTCRYRWENDQEKKKHR